ncbi:AI-2E family transporter [Flavisphingomonas formosensis]|uniref:AI-2E family transporter n=1 Tax=Flavisphingomonas formosensis TaxID=861534 RepID=UPI0012FC79F8|nr:AI-2E family transporter [Sphingomonas formosensis]
MSEDGRHVEEPGPADFQDPIVARELKRAMVWIGLALAIALLWLLAQPILLILGGLVVATMLDGGTRLLGRVLPIGRSLRLLIVCLAVTAFLIWTFYFAGSSIGAQFDTLRTVVQTQVARIFAWAQAMKLLGPGAASDIGHQLMGSIGQVTSAVGTALGAISSLAMILVIGVFIAIEPRLYERGIAWMLPMKSRANFYDVSEKMGYTLRRLMAGRLTGMAVEGVGTWILLSIGGVPMAALLGILTGLLAFLPNIGAIISGVLLVLVGFSAGTETGLWAVGVYFVVQTVDGYLIVPMVNRRSVDLAPALVLGAQLLMGALFGIMGLALADSIVAMIKVALEESSENAAEAAARA